MRISTLALAAMTALPAAADPWTEGGRNAPDLLPAFEGQTRAPQVDSGVRVAVATLAEGLAHPWAVAALPEGGYLVTERGGTLNHMTEAGALHPVAGVPEVLAEGQGGLLDVAVAPDFARSRLVYLTYAKPMGDGTGATAAARATLSGDHAAIEDLRDIFVQSPASPTTKHFGARVVPDGEVVYVTTGEHFSEAERQLAQDPAQSYGKVMRLGADGSAPADNPFPGQGGDADKVWTVGHRNVQGAALRPGTDQLWTLEHGPLGGDELNLSQRGANYGWPVVSYGLNYDRTPVGSGKAQGPGFTEPVYFWDPVIAPGGFLFYEGAMFPEWQGDILAASLSPGGLVRLDVDGDRVVGEERFLTGENRIRDIAIAPDGALLLAVDAADGRILRVSRDGG